MDNRTTDTKKGFFKNITIGVAGTSVIAITVFMTLFGLVMIFDASSYRAHQLGLNQFQFFYLQLIWVAVSLVPTLIIFFWDYRKFSKLALPAFIIVLILLVAVLFVGQEINSAKRWIDIAGIAIQPTEFLKPVLILFLAMWLSNEDKSTSKLAKAHSIKDIFQTRFGKNMIVFFVVLGFTLGLIILEPDLGTTIIIGLTSVSIFFLAGIDSVQRLWTFAMLGMFGLLGVFAGILENYRLKRILTFIDLIKTGEVSNPRTDGYQMLQILMGIGSGGILGVGFGQSRQRFGYLVENTAFTDSIFAVILEELGMIGGIFLIILWLVFFFSGMAIAMNAPDRLGKLLASGITIWLTLQALINMAANVGLMPLTGIPLPFLSYGGSNTLVTFIGVAILLNIARLSFTKESRTR
jgi:cell division protein FtsW